MVNFHVLYFNVGFKSTDPVDFLPANFKLSAMYLLHLQVNLSYLHIHSRKNIYTINFYRLLIGMVYPGVWHPVD